MREGKGSHSSRTDGLDAAIREFRRVRAELDILLNRELAPISDALKGERLHQPRTSILARETLPEQDDSVS